MTWTLWAKVVLVLERKRIFSLSSTRSNTIRMAYTHQRHWPKSRPSMLLLKKRKIGELFRYCRPRPDSSFFEINISIYKTWRLRILSNWRVTNERSVTDLLYSQIILPQVQQYLAPSIGAGVLLFRDGRVDILDAWTSSIIFEHRQGLMKKGCERRRMEELSCEKRIDCL